MVCSECGTALAVDAKFCGGCGTTVTTAGWPTEYAPGTAEPAVDRTALRGVSSSISSQPREFNRLVEAARLAFNKYGDFRGRSSRPPFWYWVLFTFLIDAAFALSGILLPAAYELLSLMQLVWGLVILVPNIAVTARRLHDTNRSGWQQLWVLTIVGVFYVIYLLVQPSDEEQNDHGPQPDW